MTPHAVTAYLGEKLRTLERWRSKGRGLPYVKLGSRAAYRTEDIGAFITARTFTAGRFAIHRQRRVFPYFDGDEDSN